MGNIVGTLISKISRCPTRKKLRVSHLDVFERDDPLRRVLRGVLEVVEAAVVEDEPPPLPVLPPAIGQHFTIVHK